MLTNSVTYSLEITTFYSEENYKVLTNSYQLKRASNHLKKPHLMCFKDFLGEQ